MTTESTFDAAFKGYLKTALGNHFSNEEDVGEMVDHITAIRSGLDRSKLIDYVLQNYVVPAGVKAEDARPYVVEVLDHMTVHMTAPKMKKGDSLEDHILNNYVARHTSDLESVRPAVLRVLTQLRKRGLIDQ